MKDLKVLLLKGCPASGKTTFAKALVEKEPNKWKRINRDSLRLMFAEQRNDQNEKFLLQVRDTLILQALESGFNVVNDDLNLSPKNEARIRQLVGKKAEVVIDDSFLSVPLDELLKRNANREDKVPEKFLKDMYEQFASKTVSKEEKSRMWLNKKEERNIKLHDPNLPSCIICDIDGTVALMNGRSPFDWNKVDTDLPNQAVVNLILTYMSLNKNVFFVSGRDGSCRQKTEEWLIRQGLENFELFMRVAGDSRKDSIVKEEIYKEHFEGKWNVEFVLDDRNQVVELWRKLGLNCFQVAEGNF